jgi:hypothetical protein
LFNQGYTEEVTWLKERSRIARDLEELFNERKRRVILGRLPPFNFLLTP